MDPVLVLLWCVSHHNLHLISVKLIRRMTDVCVRVIDDWSLCATEYCDDWRGAFGSISSREILFMMYIGRLH